MENNIQQCAKNFINNPIQHYKIELSNSLMDNCHIHCYVFHILISLSVETNWYIESAKKLLEDPNAYIGCPQGYEYLLDYSDDSTDIDSVS